MGHPSLTSQYHQTPAAAAAALRDKLVRFLAASRAASIKPLRAIFSGGGGGGVGGGKGKNESSADHVNASELWQWPRDVTVVAAWNPAYDPERLDAGFAAMRVGFPRRDVSLEEYPALLRRALFVFAPRGRGMDVHRITEAVVAGAIPVILEGVFPPAYYAHWPKVVTPSWATVTKEWLRGAAEEALRALDAGELDHRRAYADFQIARLRREQERARAWCRAHPNVSLAEPLRSQPLSDSIFRYWRAGGS